MMRKYFPALWFATNPAGSKIPRASFSHVKKPLPGRGSGLSFYDAVLQNFKFLLGSIGRVQKLLSELAARLSEELSIHILHLSIVHGYSLRHHLVFLIEGLHTPYLVLVTDARFLAAGDDGLAAAVNAAARATHNFDKGILGCTCTYFIEKRLSAGHGRCDRDPDLLAVQVDLCLLDACHTTACFKIYVLKRLAVEDLLDCTQSSFHNTAGRTEDNTCTGVLSAEVLIELLVFKDIDITS